MSIRGPYKSSKSGLKQRPTNFFHPIHENQDLYVSAASVVNRGNNQISVLYKILGNKKQFRTPRRKTVWFDKFDIELARREIDNWKHENNNFLGKGRLLPSFYLNHRKEYIKWLARTSSPATIITYEADLRIYIFPYFTIKLGIESPINWDIDSVSRWELSLTSFIDKPSERNKTRTSLRRYLKFLKFFKVIKQVPQIFNEPVKRISRETPIPGDLPEWPDVITWLESLPHGRYRFNRALMLGFGLRVSEASLITRRDFIGKESEEEINYRNDFIKELKDKQIGKLFLSVNKADKAKINKDIVQMIGDQTTKPKSGEYTACCTNKELANLILEMLHNGEDKEELARDEIYGLRRMIPEDSSPYNFHLYRPHDDRRLNITLQLFDLRIPNAIEVSCMLHGQSSRAIFDRYFQWGLVQRREKRSSTTLLPKVF